MKKLLAVVVMVCASSFAFAHGGGTDKNGCHVDHKTGVYHCH